MAYDYTALPTTDELDDVLASAGLSALSTSVAEDLQQAALDAAAKRMEKQTRRQFVAGSAGEVRWYDGSGTGRLEIDEYIDITAVDFVIFPNPSLVSATQFVEVEQQASPKTILQIFQGQANYTTAYYPKFPEGRSNIKVTGQFGYDTSIPADVYLAIVYMAAAHLADTNTVSTGGGLLLKSWVNADRQETFETGAKPSDIAGWKDFAKETIKQYRRPLGAKQRRVARPLY